MTYEIEYTDEFEAWWLGLTEPERESITAKVGLLEERGPQLGDPHTSQIKNSVYGHMRELKVQHAGRPYRILYAFDPRRVGVLLIGGDKTGRDRWYEEFVPVADELYRLHLETIKDEGLI